MGKGSNPHDALFKAVFAQPEHAGGELQAVLPDALVQALDWSTLERRPGSFVDPELAERHTDLLFSIRARAGADLLVYVLLEHQSRSDPLMPYRLLVYKVRIWESWRQADEGQRLPAIVPVVLYHGKQPWSAPQSLEPLVGVPPGLEEALSAHIPTSRYIVDDLSAIPDEALRARAVMTALGKMAVVCFTRVRAQEDPVEVLGDWVDVIHEVLRAPTGFEALVQVMRYMMLVNERAEPDVLQSFLEREVGPEAKEAVVTPGQRLIEQGVQQGLQQGLQQGELEGERKLLLRQLRQRFGDVLDPEMEQRVAKATAPEIEAWALRVLSATKLGDVLAD